MDKDKASSKEKRIKNFMIALFFFTSVMTLGSMCFLWNIIEYRRAYLKENIKERLLIDSKLAARLASAEELAYIVKPEDAGTPLYNDIKARLAVFVEENHIVKAYFARETQDGLLQYIVDSVYGEESESIATRAVKEHDSADVFRRAFAGEVSVQEAGVYVEGSEGFISAFCPVYDSAGNVAAVVGVDLPDASIVRLNFLGGIARMMVVLSGVLSTISGSINLLMYSRKTRHAEAANASKSDFLSRMSHEMRTPLNAIIGLSMLAWEYDDLQEEPKDQIRKVHEAGVTLLNIINDILDISKIESGRFELSPIEYDVPSMVNDTITVNAMRIGGKPITFTLHIPDSMPSRLYGDDLRLKQIFNNILSNAFKYTAAGTVDWTLNWERDGDSVWLTSQVTDTGMGIRKEDLEKLFKEYSQVDTKANRKVEGTGLGLAITSSMVRLMDGVVTVESEYGAGSKFTLRIRQGFVNDMSIGQTVGDGLRTFRYHDYKQERSAKFVRVKLPYAKVLVVDDVPTNLDVAKGMMKPYNMQIDCVASGRQAIDLIREEKVKYSAVFMDHMMPYMDGIEAVRIIREEIGTEYARNVPIIALTANAIRGNENIFLTNGFNAFLAKPIDVAQLDATIRQWVRDNEKDEEYAARINDEQVEQRSWLSDRRSGLDRRVGNLDFQKGVERFSGDEDAYFDVLISFCKNTPALLEKARVVTQETLGDYAVIIHGIKGSSHGICAERVGILAENLEQKAKSGDFSYVETHNNTFLRVAGALIEDIKELIEARTTLNSKQVKTEPDPFVLKSLREACESYDMDGVDAAMKELLSYEYETNAELVEWLAAQVDVIGFEEIVQRLSV